MKSLNYRRISYPKFLFLSFALQLFFVVGVQAQNLVVEFEREPLFGEVNFLPGDSKRGEVDVINKTESSQEIYVESINGFDPDGLGSQMRIRVSERGGLIYEDEFEDFLSSGPVRLSTLSSGNTATYVFEVSFIDSSDYDYQGKSLGFDLCIGFVGGNSTCSGTVIGEEGGTGGSGVSPQVGGSSQLIVFNEETNILNVGDNGIISVSWKTNKLATSRVIYGPASDGDNYPECLSSGPCYDLDLLDVPNYGYPFSTVVLNQKVTDHTVVLPNLVPGQEYSYRVVSSASPDTAGFEKRFKASLNLPQDNLVALVRTNTILDPNEETAIERSDFKNDLDRSDLSQNSFGLAFAAFGDHWQVALLIGALICGVLWYFRKKS